MIKALAVGLGLVLGAGVVSAQPKRTPKKKPPATAPKAGDAQPAATPATPAASDSPAAPPASPAPDPAASPLPPAPPPSAAPLAPAPSATPSTPGPTTSPAPATRSGSRAKPAPMRTDEKAGANDALQKNAYKNVSKADEDCATAQFRDGNLALNNGLFPKAVTNYRAALRCWDHPGIHYNLALALINLDQPVEVFEQLNEAIKYGAEPITQERFDRAREYLKLVAGQLADLEVSCDKPGAKIAVDGKEVFVAPGNYQTKVRVGKHTFSGEKEGYDTRATAPFIGPGETYRIELKLYTIAERTRYRRRWDRVWMPYAVIGGGALVGIVGGLFELSASSSYKDFNTAVAKCNTAAMGCATNTPGLIDMRNSGDTKRTLGYVGYGVGAAALATGAVLAFLNRQQAYLIRPEDLEKEQEEAQEKAQKPQKPQGVSVAPIVSPEMTGALVQGHF